MVRRGVFKVGRLEICYGPMFGEKTTWVIGKLGNWKSLGYETILYRPEASRRIDGDEAETHHGFRWPATYFENSSEIVVPEKTVFGVDDAHMADPGLVDVIRGYVDGGYTCFVSTLDRDFRGDWFPFDDNKHVTIAGLLLLADKSVNQRSNCTFRVGERPCGERAAWTQKYYGDEIAPFDSPTKESGSGGIYEPRCREHFIPYDPDTRLPATPALELDADFQ